MNHVIAGCDSTLNSLLCKTPHTASQAPLPEQYYGRAILIACFPIWILWFLLPCLGFPVKLYAQPYPPKGENIQTFRNPILWEDLADADILRVGDTYYYSASNMHYSPGAPILRSYDLVHWEYAGHSVPVLEFGPDYDLNGGSAYVKGTWASFLGYRKSNQTFYWGGCVQFSKTYIYTSKSVEGPWTRHAVLPKCYYDAGLLIDDDDTMYVAYGNTTLHVAQLSADATHEVRNEVVFTTPRSVKVLEGSRFYKVNGHYYIFATRPPDREYVLKSSGGPYGPYTLNPFLERALPPIEGAGSPHQGGIVETQRGDWYYMAFIDAYPGGRIPVLAPLKWNSEGWPELELKDNTWNVSYPYPLPPHPLGSMTGTDGFNGTALSPEWEWNHNPDNSKWSLDHGLVLKTATVTQDLYLARNTLTHRILGPQSTATVELDISAMKNGDCAGLALFRDSSAWVGVERQDGGFRVVMKDGLIMDRSWQTKSTGTEIEGHPVTASRIWLRASADIHPKPGRTAHFFWSSDGKVFYPIGRPFELGTSWPFFMGYRYAIFNYATTSLGGEVHAISFTMNGAQ
jgi:beta-xylosidase